MECLRQMTENMSLYDMGTLLTGVRPYGLSPGKALQANGAIEKGYQEDQLK